MHYKSPKEDRTAKTKSSSPHLQQSPLSLILERNIHTRTHIFKVTLLLENRRWLDWVKSSTLANSPPTVRGLRISQMTSQQHSTHTLTGSALNTNSSVLPVCWLTVTCTCQR